MGKYFAPIKGEGVERRDELNKTTVGDTGIPRKRPHRGNDWGFKNGSLGKPVYAMHDGVVTKVAFSSEVQGHVTVRGTDGISVVYCHFDYHSITVKKETEVIGGETVLGKLGPYVHGPHLHTAASKNPSPLTCDPKQLLDVFDLLDNSRGKTETATKKTVKKKAAK